MVALLEKLNFKALNCERYLWQRKDDSRDDLISNSVRVNKKTCFVIQTKMNLFCEQFDKIPPA
jgi:hypothetical protein